MIDISGWRKRQIALDQIKDRIELETTPLINFTKQKEWVELTHAEFAEILCDDRWQGRPELMLLQAQAKLKDKNA
jgi:hypothetical protein